MRLVAKHAEVGYQTPGERPGCRNCVHAETYRPESGVCYNAPRLTCTKHGLEITSGGICNDHRAQVVRQAPDPRVGDMFDLVDTTHIPAVGEMHEGKPMTPARHQRLLCQQLIRNEEASGDPELLRVAAFRRRALGMAPHHGEMHA